MTPREFFGVGVRLVGLMGALIALPSLSLNLVSAAPLVVGLILLKQPDLVVSLCYPPDRHSPHDDHEGSY